MREDKQPVPEGRKPRTGTGRRPEGGVPPDALTTALRMLTRRPYSIAEMRRALERKCPQSEQVSAAIARLRELGYLDDRKFAEQTAYSLAQNRAFGPHRLRRELKARKVDYKYVEPAVKQAYQETSPREVLEQALDKKMRTLRLPLTLPRFHALCQSLLRRGFNASDIMKAVRSRPELSPVAEEVELIDLEEPNTGL